MVLFMKLIGNRGIEKFLELFRLALHKVKFGLKVFHAYFALFVSLRSFLAPFCEFFCNLITLDSMHGL